MRYGKLKVLAAAAGILLAWFGSARGHGSHFHSLDELASHIGGHVARLEAKLAEGNLSQAEIRRECGELIEHAAQYRQLAARWIRNGKNAPLGKKFDAASRELAHAAQKGELVFSLGILRQILEFVRPSFPKQSFLN